MRQLLKVESLETLKRRAEAPQGTATRFLGNHNKKVFHDLDEEVLTCQIDKMTEKHFRHFPTRAAAEDAGYDPCDWCLLGLGKEHDIDEV